MCSTLFSNNDPTQHKGNSESGSHKGDRLTGTQGEADDPEKEVCMGVHFGTAFKVVHVNALGNAFVRIANFESCLIKRAGADLLGSSVVQFGIQVVFAFTALNPPK